jgi:hypothetical protein
VENKFTDDDLKRLKDVIDGHDLYSDLVRDEDIEALLTRLEAAEALIKSADKGVFATYRYEAWVKAAGK